MQALSEYYQDGQPEDQHTFILNYSCIEMQKLPEIISKIKKVL